MAKKTNIYPIFLPHFGCPFQCVYCNQNKVTTGPEAIHSTEDIVRYCRGLLSYLEAAGPFHAAPMQVAFYGGTFTGLPEPVLRAILESAQSLVEKKILSGIRFSTRPDYVTPGICALLADYSIHAVELGVQSFDETVLARNRRGYTAETVERAAGLIHRHHWTLGIQLMLGLPGDEAGSFLDSVRMAVSLGATLIRFYPALVLENTLLARWYRDGLYHPLNLEEAIRWCVPAYDLLLRKGIPPVRMGLQADRKLAQPGSVLAGPYHPAFGYLVRAAWWRKRVDDVISADPGSHVNGHGLCLYVPERFVSEVLGHGRENVAYWKNKWSVSPLLVRGDPYLEDTTIVLNKLLPSKEV